MTVKKTTAFHDRFLIIDSVEGYHIGASLKEAGKLMISVLSAVAEIERENIRVQTMEGRMQKAREGKWNGGFPPYGYSLIDGELIINEEEAVAIRTIFAQIYS